jgi:hypothetical protein
VEAVVAVRLPEVLAKYASGRALIPVDAATVAGAILEISAAYPDLAERLVDRRGTLRAHLSATVGDRVIPHEALDTTPIEADDEIVVLVALAGGAGPCAPPLRGS